MNLTIDNALHGIAELLRDRISPEIGDPFAAQMARLSCMLLTICANGVDDAAAIRVEENAAIRALLGDAAELVDPALAQPAVNLHPSNPPRNGEVATKRTEGSHLAASDVLDAKRDPSGASRHLPVPGRTDSRFQHAALAERLAAATASVDPGLKIGVLDGENHRLRGLLVEAQAVIERRDDPDARTMDQRIWRLLEAIEITRAPREKAT